MKFIATLVLAALAITNNIYGQASRAPVLDKLLADFETAFNAKDAAKLASFYAEDAVLMPPGSPLVKGRAAIQAAFTTMLARGGVVKFNPPLESEIVGSRAFVAGTYTLTIPAGRPLPLTKPSESGPQIFAAKYLTVFKRVGNDWKIAYDMQNSDQAAPR